MICIAGEGVSSIETSLGKLLGFFKFQFSYL